MSESVIYGIKEGQKTQWLTSFKNGRGLSLMVWAAYFKQYLSLDYFERMLEDSDYDKLWPLYKDSRLPHHHKTVLLATYDYTVIPVEMLPSFVADLEAWDADMSGFIDGYVNHVPDLAVYLKSKDLSQFDFIGIQVNSGVDNQYDINWNPRGRKGVKPGELKNIYDLMRE